MRGVMICGHGSRDSKAVEQFSTLTKQLSRRLPDLALEYGYLEFARPVIYEGLDRLIAKGVSDIRAVPALLFAAGHAKNDIPCVLNSYMAQRQNGIAIRYGRELGIDANMLSAAEHRIRKAMTSLKKLASSDTLLAVIGRGSSDPDANSNVSKITRMLWEGFGFGWAVTGYSGVTFPLVEPCLEYSASLGFKRIIVFPYFLFTGVLIDRIYDYTDKVAARHPDIEFVKASYLGAHPMVIETFVQRIAEIDSGENRMNCQLCKYREQILGFGAEKNLPQQSHHHHVEGIGTGKAQQHSHHHHPYPHREHPLGPLSMTKKNIKK